MLKALMFCQKRVYFTVFITLNKKSLTKRYLHPFQSTRVPTYQRMFQFMESNPTVFVKTNEEGIERVKKSKGKYAYLLESPLNEYNNNKEPCDTLKVGNNLNSKGYGIATRKNSKYRYV